MKKFSIVIGICIVAIVAGLLIMRHRDTKRDAKSSSSQNTAPTSPQSSATKELVIGEWAIKIPLDKIGVADVSYITGAFDNSSAEGIIFFDNSKLPKVSDLSSADRAEVARCAQYTPGTFYRVKTSDASEAPEGVAHREIAGYSYRQSAAQAACALYMDGADPKLKALLANLLSFGDASTGLPTIQSVLDSIEQQ